MIQQAKKTSAMASVMFRSALAPAEQWLVDLEAVRGLMSPPDRAHAGNQTHQLAARMKMKIEAKNQNVRSTRCGPMIPSRNLCRPLNQPLPEVLGPCWNRLHFRVAS